jgi:hypothetical protein
MSDSFFAALFLAWWFFIGPMTKFLKAIFDGDKRQVPSITIDKQPPQKKKSIYFAAGMKRGGGPTKKQVRVRAKECMAGEGVSWDRPTKLSCLP